MPGSENGDTQSSLPLNENVRCMLQKVIHVPNELSQSSSLSSEGNRFSK